MSKLEVVKYGSDLIANRHGIDRSRIEGHVSRISEKKRLIVVTSGAVAVGKALYRHIKNDILSETLENQKYLAGLGCTAVFHTFEQAFLNERRLAASYPITHYDLDNNDQLLVAVEANLCRETVVIFNEADAYSQTELMKLKTGGDNDGLAAHVAIVAGADKLTIVTEHGGIVDDNKKLIECVDSDNVQAVAEMLASRGVSSNGRGGIATKATACMSVAQRGIEAVITDEHGDRATRFMLG